MKVSLVAALILIFAGNGAAQEAELPEVVVTGTFELRRGPSVTDLFTLHLLKQVETSRGLEETMARAPWYYSSLWKYFPMRLDSSSSDPSQFFTPRYLSLEIQSAEAALRKAEKESVFDR